MIKSSLEYHLDVLNNSNGVWPHKAMRYNSSVILFTLYCYLQILIQSSIGEELSSVFTFTSDLLSRVWHYWFAARYVATQVAVSWTIDSSLPFLSFVQPRSQPRIIVSEIASQNDEDRYHCGAVVVVVGFVGLNSERRTHQTILLSVETLCHAQPIGFWTSITDSLHRHAWTRLVTVSTPIIPVIWGVNTSLMSDILVTGF